MVYNNNRGQRHGHSLDTRSCGVFSRQPAALVGPHFTCPRNRHHHVRCATPNQVTDHVQHREWRPSTAVKEGRREEGKEGRRDEGKEGRGCRLPSKPGTQFTIPRDLMRRLTWLMLPMLACTCGRTSGSIPPFKTFETFETIGSMQQQAR